MTVHQNQKNDNENYGVDKTANDTEKANCRESRKKKSGKNSPNQTRLNFSTFIQGVTALVVTKLVIQYGNQLVQEVLEFLQRFINYM
jgi:hypothetical protein